MIKEIRILINRVISLAIDVDITTDNDVIVEYSGHAQCLCIYYYPNGYEKGEEYIEIINSYFRSISIEESLKNLSIALEKLYKLKERGELNEESV